MTPITTSFLQAALKKRALTTQGHIPKEFSKICIDSRTVEAGSLFVALPGENFDGHTFVAQAIRKGASAALVSSRKAIQLNTDLPLLICDDALLALQDIAHTHLLKMPARRVALTGSNGKTTTKEMIRCVLSACVGPEHVYASRGNLNNHIGVPLSCMEVLPEHQIAILEMGMNHFGEIATLANIVLPQVRLITNMGSAHAGNLGGLDGVAKAKAELWETMSESDIAIVNVDDPRCMREAQQKAKGKQISFGKASWANVRLTSVKESADATAMDIEMAYNGNTQHIRLPLLGAHNATNAAGAVAVAVALGFDFATAAKGLENMHAVKGRLQKHTLKNGALLIDDTYNANPESMEAGLGVLAGYTTRRRVAVLGQMGELGDFAPALHRGIGAACVQKRVDKIYACGEFARQYGEGAIDAGMPRELFVWAPDSEQLKDIVKNEISSGDVVFVKGSRSQQMEKVVQQLLAM